MLQLAVQANTENSTLLMPSVGVTHAHAVMNAHPFRLTQFLVFLATMQILRVTQLALYAQLALLVLSQRNLQLLAP